MTMNSCKWVKDGEQWNAKVPKSLLLFCIKMVEVKLHKRHFLYPIHGFLFFSLRIHNKKVSLNWWILCSQHGALLWTIKAYPTTEDTDTTKIMSFLNLIISYFSLHAKRCHIFSTVNVIFSWNYLLMPGYPFLSVLAKK